MSKKKLGNPIGYAEMDFLSILEGKPKMKKAHLFTKDGKGIDIDFEKKIVKEGKDNEET